MSAHANPDIVDDNLVFIYDTDDGKSYKGEPTTNVIAGTSLINTVAGTYTTNTTVDGVRILENNQVNNSHVMWNGATGFIVTCSAGAYVTVSAEYKTNCTIRMRFRDNPYDSQYDIDGGNIATISEQSVDIDTDGEWKHYSLTAQTSTANPDLWWYMVDYRNNNEFGRVEIRNWQVEVKSHATQFVDGTRSATQGLIDRTGTSTINISNASFDSNAQMAFDGTDDYADVADQDSLDLTTAMSFEFFVKPDSSQSNPYPRLIDKSVYLLHLSETSPFSVFQNIYTSGGLRQTGISSVVTAGNWNHIVCTYDGQYGKIYVDAELVKTRDFGSVLACNTNSSSLRIAGDGTTNRPLNGEIPISKIYNRALTAAEVLQNFNATKSRFGL